MSIAIRVNGRRRSSPVVYPVKGDIIGIDMDGDGTDEQYLVLKTVSNGVVEVLARVTPSDGTSISFAVGGSNTYEGNTLDTFVNSTYYNTLSETGKAAIVNKTFRQDSWYNDTSGDPDYNGSYSNGTSYQVSFGNASFGNEISRHIYTLSVQDIIDYLEVTTDMTSANSTLNMANVQEMFNTTSDKLWLRSASAGSSGSVMRARGDSGRVNAASGTNSSAARPAFQIDLSKIAWTPLYNMSISGNGDSTYCYIVDLNGETPVQYYTNGQTFTVESGNSILCCVNNVAKRVTIDGVEQTLDQYGNFNFTPTSNCTITMSFNVNDHSYIDITTT